MPNYSRQVLHIDLSKQSASLGSFADLGKLLGGLGIGLDLLSQFREQSPTVFSIGPLNGYFPFVSKVCALSLISGKVVESYLSGRVSLMMRFAGIDSLVITGVSATPLYLSIYPGGVVDFLNSPSAAGDFLKSGIAGRRTFLTFSNNRSLSDDYFDIETEIGRKLYLTNLLGFTISGDSALPIARESDYRELYLDLMGKGNLLRVPYDGNMSCGGCPAGCDFSKLEEQEFELVLSHSLVACGFAGPIYEDIPLIFSCLNSLGLPYRHEDLESLPERIKYLKESF